MKTALALTAFAFGSVIGSFLNVCIYRIPRKISIVFPSSFCTACNKLIPFYCNIPILSYIMLGGKCKFCGRKFSARYPLVELLGGLAAGVCVINWQFPENIVYFAFIASLIVITFIDLDFQIIPDRISLPGIVIGAFFSFFIIKTPLLRIIIAVVLGGGIFYLIGIVYELIAKREGMGGGDVKLMAMIGAFLGIRSIPFIIMVSSLSGTLVGLYYMYIKKQSSKFAIPFGPFLAFGALLYLFFGDIIIAWYLSLLT